jgi:hypothetical protein
MVSNFTISRPKRMKTAERIDSRAELRPQAEMQIEGLVYMCTRITPQIFLSENLNQLVHFYSWDFFFHLSRREFEGNPRRRSLLHLNTESAVPDSHFKPPNWRAGHESAAGPSHWQARPPGLGGRPRSGPATRNDPSRARYAGRRGRCRSTDAAAHQAGRWPGPGRRSSRHDICDSVAQPRGNLNAGAAASVRLRSDSGWHGHG